MKKKLYIRIGSTTRGYIADASFTPNQAPLFQNKWKYGGNQRIFVPTVHFALNVEISEQDFVEAGRVIGDINLQLGEKLKIAAEVAELNEPQNDDKNNND